MIVNFGIFMEYQPHLFSFLYHMSREKKLPKRQGSNRHHLYVNDYSYRFEKGSLERSR